MASSDPRQLMPLEVLHLPLMLLGGGAGGEGAQVATLASLGVLLAGVEAVLAGVKLADHGLALRLDLAGFIQDLHPSLLETCRKDADSVAYPEVGIRREEYVPVMRCYRQPRDDELPLKTP